MIALHEILDNAKQYDRKVNTEIINDAYVYSSRMHDGQLRKSGEPYFVHPASVASIITQMRLDSSSICAALLHDVLEDTSAGREEIVDRFGEEIAFLVEGVTKLGKLNFISREDRQAESFRKMLVAMAQDIRVLLVKLADRLDNMRTLQHMHINSQRRIALETMDIYAPLAGRLGIQWLKDELEDLSFTHLFPDPYNDVSQKLIRVTRDANKYIEKVVNELQRLLTEKEFNVEVTGRLKHPYSIYRKMRSMQCEFEQVHDLMAFRVLTEKPADCYAVLGVVHSRWMPVPGHFKDYIALPKSNMYQSLHTTVIGPNRKRIEIQIRTPEMHRTADLGIAAHWKYKENGVTLDDKDIARFTWLRNLMEYQENVSDPDEFLDGVKVDLFNDEVYVFTPKGDLRVFPRGATPIDFAYSIHSDVGHHCAGARINGSIVPLRYTLHNGDTVEILTSNKQHPSKDWLNFVATARARSRIRGFIRFEERKKSINLGRDLLERYVRKNDLSFSRLLKSRKLDGALEPFNCNSVDDLFAQIGYGKISANQVYHSVFPDEQSVPANSLRPNIIEKAVEKVARRSGSGDIVIDNVNDVLVRFAKCCNPLPGDPITGWITRGRGVTIHRRGCMRAMELAPERRVAVSWSGDAKEEHRVVLRIVTADRPGILARLSEQFTSLNVNIEGANCRTLQDGRAINIFEFSIRNVARLQTLIRAIEKIDGVYEIERE